MKTMVITLATIIAWGTGSPAWADDTDHDHLINQREKMIRLLEEYAKKGEFPFGKKDSKAISKEDPHFDPKQRLTHRIIGPNGFLCALAHLISKSGNEDLVKDLEKNDNHFCVGKDRHKGVEKWILTSGLTLEECIQIQFPGRTSGQPEPRDPGLLSLNGEMTNFYQIQRHLLEVVAALKKNTKKSLHTAMERLDKAKS